MKIRKKKGEREMILCITCMRKITQMTIDFLSETMEVRRNWHISKKPKVGGKKKTTSHPKIQFPVQISFRNERKIRMSK